MVWDHEVAGSNPVFPTIYNLTLGALAQLGERLPCTQEVSGSIPLGSTYFILKNKISYLTTLLLHDKINKLSQKKIGFAP